MINIAIDGPSGAGKSTIARKVAAALGYVYVDTGAMYRAIGVHVMRNGLHTDNREEVCSVLDNAIITIGYVDGEQHVFLNDDDVSTDIRLPAASMAASNVSAIPEVRQHLFNLQQDIAKNNNCIMDGRDIGTVVLPNAQVKIFLTASAEVRTKRRFDELKAKGTPVDFDVLLAEIQQRDYNDSHRAVAPLKQAEDAILLDCSEMDIEQTSAAILRIIGEKI